MIETRQFASAQGLVLGDKGYYLRLPPMPKTEAWQKHEAWIRAGAKLIQSFRHDVAAPKSLSDLIKRGGGVTRPAPNDMGQDYAIGAFTCRVYNQQGRIVAARSMPDGTNLPTLADDLRRETGKKWIVQARSGLVIGSIAGADELVYDVSAIFESRWQSDDLDQVLREAVVPNAILPLNDDQPDLKVSPLVKWAGGKRAYAGRILSLALGQCPAPKRYIEPFAGGGAVFFALREMLSGIRIGDGSGQTVTPILTPDRSMPAATLSDACTELIDTYRAVAAEPEEVICRHEALRASYADAWTQGTGEDWYYHLRAKHIDLPREPIVSRAAWFLAINRLNFNGLHRVNSKGLCNVPWGQGGPDRMIDPARIREAHVALQATKITCRDWREGVEEARESGEGTILFLDPPYPGTFDAYTATRFSSEEQVALERAANSAREAGATVIVTLPDNEFVRKAWSESRWISNEGGERRSINSDAKGRGGVLCLILIGRRE